MAAMLGHSRRTTRTDVALALTLAGLVYLAWVLAVYVAKGAAVQLSALSSGEAGLAVASTLPVRVLRGLFTGTAATGIDIIGPIWLVAGLWLVIRASRQRRIISWSWLVMSLQAIAAILFAVLAGHARGLALAAAPAAPLALPAVTWSPAVVTVAVLIWLATLAWLIHAARLGRGPVRRDGLKTQLSRR